MDFAVSEKITRLATEIRMRAKSKKRQKKVPEVSKKPGVTLTVGKSVRLSQVVPSPVAHPRTATTPKTRPRKLGNTHVSNTPSSPGQKPPSPMTERKTHGYFQKAIQNVFSHQS